MLDMNLKEIAQNEFYIIGVNIEEQIKCNKCNDKRFILYKKDYIKTCSCFKKLKVYYPKNCKPSELKIKIRQLGFNNSELKIKFIVDGHIYKLYNKNKSKINSNDVYEYIFANEEECKKACNLLLNMQLKEIEEYAKKLEDLVNE